MSNNMAASKDTKSGRNRKRQTTVNENSPVIKAFRGYQAVLDAKHDRYERLVKLSRDVTIESKRVIFLLQRCAGEEAGERQAVLQQAEVKLKEIQLTKFLPIAQELQGQDHFQFIRAYAPGLEEYIEAVSFYQYLKNKQFVTLSSVVQDLTFKKPPISTDSVDPPPGTEDPGSVSSSTQPSSSHTVNADNTPTNTDSVVDENKTHDAGKNIEVTSTSCDAGNDGGQSSECDSDVITVTVPPTEFMLGIADLTGELMRTAIMSVSAGDLDYPSEICDFMRIIHDAFQSYGNTARELTRKMSTLRQSLQKVENACYTLKVRGSEIPKHMLASIFATSSTEGNFAEDMDDAPAFD